MVDFGGGGSLMRSEADGGSLFRNHVGEESGPHVQFQSNDAASVQRTTAAPASGDSAVASGQSGIVRYGDGSLQSSSSYQQTALHTAHFDPEVAAAAGPVRTSEGKGVLTVPGTLLESMYQEQVSLATPKFMDGVDLSHVYPADKNATADLAVSIGRMVQQGDTMTFSYSVENRGVLSGCFRDQWRRRFECGSSYCIYHREGHSPGRRLHTRGSSILDIRGKDHDLTVKRRIEIASDCYGTGPVSVHNLVDDRRTSRCE